jgi:hypothetical protein
VVLAALLVLLGVVALSDDSPTPTNDPRQATPAPTTTFSLPTVATTLATTSTAPPTTIKKITVPRLVGMRLARAKDSLADRGLTAKVTYRSTARYSTTDDALIEAGRRPVVACREPSGSCPRGGGHRGFAHRELD